MVPAVAIIGLGMMGINDDARSYFGMCVLAAMLSLWQIRSRAGTGALSRWFPAILIAGSAAAVYFLASALLTSGYFGLELQERSVTQIETTGSLIAGGRPEWSATRELMRTNPEGYGIGVVPTWEDLMIGKKGLASINVDTGGYAAHFMFGGEFRLHSVIADLWVGYGLVGLALGFTMAWSIVRSLSSSITDRQAATSVIFACTLALWYLFFGPLYSNWLEVCLAVGLVLIPVAHRARLPALEDVEVGKG